MKEITFSPHAIEEYVSKYIGYATTVMSINEKYKQFQFAAVPLWIRIPIVHDQFKVFFDQNGVPIGFVSWAKVCKKTLAALLADSQYILHASEWNDGEIVWITDLCVNRNYFREVFDSLSKDPLFESDVYSAKRRIDGSFIRVKKWN